jgi:hypothetical protein
MTDPGFVPATERGLLAVYSSPEEARAAADRVEALGVRPESIRIAEKADEVASLRAEMREELTKSWFMPTAGVMATKESAKGALLVGTVATLIGLAVAVPLAFIDYGATLGVRLVLSMVLAGIFGGLIGFIFGGARAAKTPNELLAAQRGVVVRVDRNTPAIREALVSLGPIRLDEIAHDGTPLETVVTEDELSEEGVTEHVVSNLRGEGYRPVDHPERDADRSSRPADPPR